MSKVLELGIKEAELGTWLSWGIAVIGDTPRLRYSVYLTFPLAITLNLLIEKPLLPDRICAGSKWWWLDIRFGWYRFINIRVNLPLWLSTKADW